MVLVVVIQTIQLVTHMVAAIVQQTYVIAIGVTMIYTNRLVVHATRVILIQHVHQNHVTATQETMTIVILIIVDIVRRMLVLATHVIQIVLVLALVHVIQTTQSVPLMVVDIVTLMLDKLNVFHYIK